MVSPAVVAAAVLRNLRRVALLLPEAGEFWLSLCFIAGAPGSVLGK